VSHEADLAFSYPDAERAARVADSLRPEVGDIQGDRTRATLAVVEDTVTVGIEAADLVALRAGINTWTSLVSVAERTGTGEAR